MSSRNLQFYITRLIRISYFVFRLHMQLYIWCKAARNLDRSYKLNYIMEFERIIDLTKELYGKNYTKYLRDRFKAFVDAFHLHCHCWMFDGEDHKPSPKCFECFSIVRSSTQALYLINYKSKKKKNNIIKSRKKGKYKYACGIPWNNTTSNNLWTLSFSTIYHPIHKIKGTLIT